MSKVTQRAAGGRFASISKYIPRLAILLACLLIARPASSQEKSMTIEGYPSFQIAGSAWLLFLDGRIDADAPQRIERYIEQDSVDVSLSPGGSAAFAEAVEHTLLSWNVPDADRVSWDPTKFDIQIGRRRRCDRGKGIRAITCAGFF